jgi:hypothetical protein
MNNPWLKFYPTDWRADPALRMCSLGARGLWMEILCIMHGADPRGFLLVNGVAVSDRQLAGLAGCSPKEAAAFLAELESAGVFSRTESGVIFSRRMRRDDEKAARDKANGRCGGNPDLIRGVNPPDNPSHNGEDKAQKLEARIQNPEKKTKTLSGSRKRAPDRAPVYPDEFSMLWETFPKHPNASKSEALKSWERLDDDDREKCLDGAMAYERFLSRERAKRPDYPALHLTTFINQRRFETLLETETSH